MGRTGTASIVDVPLSVAEWLTSFGVLPDGPSVLDARGQAIRQVRGDEWAEVQSGKVRASAGAAACCACGLRCALGREGGAWPLGGQGCTRMRAGFRACLHRARDAWSSAARARSCAERNAARSCADCTRTCVRCAQLVGSILAAVFIEHGQPNPVPRMRDGDTPAVFLHNWNALQPHLSTFGVNFTPDDKALIVAGGALRTPHCACGSCGQNVRLTRARACARACAQTRRRWCRSCTSCARAPVRRCAVRQGVCDDVCR
jgi:hypothetical protein